MNQYTMISKLGQGAFSVVYKVKRRQDNKEYAMKKIRITSLSQKEIANCLNQVRILASINDPHILGYKDSFFQQLSNTFCIVTQCLEGGDLFQMINKHKNMRKLVDQSLIWKVAQQCLTGLSTLHQMNVLHRDIKCANIFLTKEMNVKLADMNVSIVTSNGMAKTQTGTPYYASPQVWMERPYSAKCDIWSLGCVLYELAALKPPFVSQDLRSLKKCIVSGIYKRIPLHYSNELQNFIRLCLKVDPRDRLSSNQLLEHELIKKRTILRQGIQTESGTCSSTAMRKLIQKISVPRRRDFRNIKQLLPKHRFGQSSMDKIISNKSAVDQKNKENVLNFVNSTKITKKDELPTIKRSSSLNGKQQNKLKNQIKIINDCKPPIMKKSIRA